MRAFGVKWNFLGWVLFGSGCSGLQNKLPVYLGLPFTFNKMSLLTKIYIYFRNHHKDEKFLQRLSFKMICRSWSEPSIPLVGMGRTTSSISFRPGSSHCGDPVRLPLPLLPQTTNYNNNKNLKFVRASAP